VESWLDYHRATLLYKCQGLTGDQLARRAVGPSSLSLLGLVRHMAEVERAWFRRRFAGEAELGYLFCSEQHPDGDFDFADGAGAEADFAAFAAECALAREAAAGRSLDDTFQHTQLGAMDLRWIYIHMIEEYARHNGHADILREQIDGVTGDLSRAGTDQPGPGAGPIPYSPSQASRSWRRVRARTPPVKRLSSVTSAMHPPGGWNERAAWSVLNSASARIRPCSGGPKTSMPIGGAG
jgi:Protein of unknown function (DUF664)